MRYCIALCIGLLASFCFADTIYQQTDSQGNVTYTDSPSSHSKAIVIPSSDSSLSTTSSSTSSSTSSTSSAVSATATPDTSVGASSDTDHVPYTAMSMTTPVDQETFQNQRLIPVTVALEPALQKGDKVQLYVDNAIYGAPVDGVNLAINQLDRGSHTVSAVVIDKNKAALKSTKTITIFVQYARLGTGVP